MTGTVELRAPSFHRLTVSAVEPLTEDAVAVTLEIPDALADEFSFLPGQHVTVRADIGGHDVRRSYSISCAPGRGRIRVGVKRIPGGAFSTYATSVLQSGDTLDVMPPVGDFVLDTANLVGRHFVAIVAGSGITPVMSMVDTALGSEASCRFTVIYGNRTSMSVMFLDELEDLKDRHRSRLHLMHVLSREPQAVDLFTGRIDAEKLDAVLTSLVDPTDVDGWFLCGPAGLIESARATLTAHGVDAGHVHDELFFAGDAPPVTIESEEEAQQGSVHVGFTLDGRRSTVGTEQDQTLLDAAMRVRGGLPFSCKGGVCATCKAKLLDGEVTMDKNFALVGSEVDAGFILTCQAHPTSDTVEIDFDV